MNIKIKDKNGITLKTQNKFVTEDINVLVDESILGGDSVGASIKGGWQGTAVPNEGYVENIYLNTNLSVEEVVSLLEPLTLYDTETNGEWLLGCSTSVIFVFNQDNMWFIADILKGVVFFSTDIFADMGIDFIGWNTNLTMPYIINNEVVNSEPSGDVNIPIGTQNHLITSLFSTTPFETKTIQLEGEYDGSTVEITDLSGGWEGTTVPESGLIENIYINYNLSHDEVVDICKKLDFIEFYDMLICPIIVNMDMTKTITILKEKGVYNEKVDVYAIYFTADNYDMVVFYGADLGDYEMPENIMSGFGWLEKDFTLRDLNIENALSTLAPMFNFTLQNKKLTSLFSSTPFTKSEPNTINVENYINNKQIPLKFKINVDTQTTPNDNVYDMEFGY